MVAILTIDFDNSLCKNLAEPYNNSFINFDFQIKNLNNVREAIFNWALEIPHEED